MSVLLIPSQQCSFSGRRTVLMFQVSIALMLLGPVEPSNACPPCVGGEHMYSDPARLMPSRRTVLPPASLRRLPWTCSAFAAGRPANGSSTPPPVPAVPFTPACPVVPLLPVVPAIPGPLSPPLPVALVPFAHASSWASNAIDRKLMGGRP